MTSRKPSFPMRKANPLLAKPWPPIPRETLEVVRKQHAALFCCDPYWIRIAQDYPGGEEAYWNECSVGVTIRREDCTPFSLAELKQLSVMEVVVRARKIQHPEG